MSLSYDLPVENILSIKLDFLVARTAVSALSENISLPIKFIFDIFVVGPSVISNIRSIRL